MRKVKTGQSGQDFLLKIHGLGVFAITISLFYKIRKLLDGICVSYKILGKLNYDHPALISLCFFLEFFESYKIQE